MSWPWGAGPSGRPARTGRRRVPAAGDLRGERRGRPGVHDVGVADEAAGHAALVLGVAARRPASTGRSAARSSVGMIGWSWSGSPSASSGYQTGNGTPKKRWREIEPVAVEAADPVVVAVLHEVGDRSRSPSPRASSSSRSVVVAAAVADVPLAGGDDLERLVALLVEVGLPLGRPSARRRGRRTRAAAPTIASRALKDGLAGELGVRRRRAASAASHSGVSREQAAVAADDGADRQLQLAPPHARR